MLLSFSHIWKAPFWITARFSLKRTVSSSLQPENVFSITAKAGTYGKNSTPISLSYGAATKTYSEINANRKGADLLKTIDVANTSQWDYEGYLGFKNFGYTATFTAATSIRLEDGQWSLSNDLYKKIKGTVILYDADDRAATDYE